MFGRNLLYSLALVCSLLVILGDPARAEVRIVEPQDQTMVKPGEKLRVEVQSSGDEYSAIFLHGLNSKVNEVPVDTVRPFVFEVQVPTVASPGPLGLTAVGYTREMTKSVDRIALLVSSLEKVEEIIVDPPELVLDSGDSWYVAVLQAGANHDAYEGIMNGWPGIEFRSEDPSVAEVSEDGLVIPKSSGQTNVHVTYQDVSAVVSVVVNLPDN